MYGLNIWFPNHLPFLMEEASNLSPVDILGGAELSWIRYLVITLLSLTSKVSEEALPKKQSLLRLQFFLLKISMDALPQEMIIISPIFKPSLCFLRKFLKAYFATWQHFK